MSLRKPEDFEREGSRVFQKSAPSRDSVRGWIKLSQNFMRDSQNKSISNELRVISAYESILNLALAVLAAYGYRITSAVGHHAQAIESASALVGAGIRLFDKVDSIRDIRNRKYTGYAAGADDVKEASAALDEFAPLCVDWLTRKYPALLKS